MTPEEEVKKLKSALRRMIWWVENSMDGKIPRREMIDAFTKEGLIGLYDRLK